MPRLPGRPYTDSPVRGRDPRSRDLTGLGVDPLRGDLRSMLIQTHHDRHPRPPQAPRFLQSPRGQRRARAEEVPTREPGRARPLMPSIKSRRPSRTGDERQCERKSGQHGRQPETEGQLAAGPDHLPHVGHHRQGNENSKPPSGSPNYASSCAGPRWRDRPRRRRRTCCVVARLAAGICRCHHRLVKANAVAGAPD
jgi:hypothetical protein